jgi:hypothetical protein
MLLTASAVHHHCMLPTELLLLSASCSRSVAIRFGAYTYCPRAQRNQAEEPAMIQYMITAALQVVDRLHASTQSAYSTMKTTVPTCTVLYPSNHPHATLM